MKNFYVISVIFLFFTSNAFGYSCYFRPYSGDIRVADINGRQIYTLFTPHIFTERQRFHAAYSFAVAIRDVNAVMSLMQQALVSYADTTNSEKSDFRQISLLLDSQKIDWIGIEYFPNTQRIENEMQEYQLAKETFNLYSILPGWNQENTDDLLYALYYVEVRLLVEHPGVVLDGSGTRITPLEDRDLHSAAEEIFTALGESRDILRIDNVDSIIDEQKSAFFNFIDTHEEKEGLLSLIDSRELEEFFTSSGIEDSELIRRIRDYVDLRNENTIAQQERDKFVVDSILVQEGNGLVLRGSAHQENVEGGLTQACLESRSL